MTEQKQSVHSRCVVIVVAAGRGVRAGGDVPKQYRALGGVPVLRRTVESLARSPHVDGILPVIHPDDKGLFDGAMAGGPATLTPVAGGATRQASVLNGLRALRDAPPRLVLIHDAARPGIDTALVERIVTALDDDDGAVPALPVVDTLKRSGDGRRCEGTVARDGLWRVQTPQGFRYDAIIAAHERAAASGAEDMTDDAAVAEAAGLSVALVDGSEENAKLTTDDDFSRAEKRLAQGSVFRTGLGYDVHRFGPGTSVMLCGVEIPCDRSLLGHSDADVGLHAITDALLGAIGAGDIGALFPPSDAQWRGADSTIFLARAGELVRDASGTICNVDATIICEAPRIGPHRDAMRRRVAAVLEIDTDRVNVKGTTTEKLGFTGRGEGIAAEAVATVRLPG